MSECLHRTIRQTQVIVPNAVQEMALEIAYPIIFRGYELTPAPIAYCSLPGSAEFCQYPESSTVTCPLVKKGTQLPVTSVL